MKDLSQLKIELLADPEVRREYDLLGPQAEINPVHRVIFDVVADLPSTERGNGGFGSTGK